MCLLARNVNKCVGNVLICWEGLPPSTFCLIARNLSFQKKKKRTEVEPAPKHTSKCTTLFIVDYTKWAHPNNVFPLQYFSLLCLGTRLQDFIVFSFNFPMEMMVVKPTGEVLVHYNANELLKIAEQDNVFTAFS